MRIFESAYNEGLISHVRFYPSSPHTDHAVLMVKYAHKISRGMSHMTQTLETKLGPDTADLLLRIGIHSGPVTAGVIRGEKARFQLFGKCRLEVFLFLSPHQDAVDLTFHFVIF